MATENNPSENTLASEDDWLDVVKQKVAKLRFGSIQITVHDGRVTQVESVEKTRFVPRAKED
jgi:hypothetical protein